MQLSCHSSAVAASRERGEWEVEPRHPTAVGLYLCGCAFGCFCKRVQSLCISVSALCTYSSFVKSLTVIPLHLLRTTAVYPNLVLGKILSLSNYTSTR